MSKELTCDVAIIGAGPAGAVAAGLLTDKGHDVLVLEREHFPRFSIGESLLPHSMEQLDEAQMLGVVKAANFQLKNGANFQFGDESCTFDFSEQFSRGWTSTFEVKRASFDHILADRAQEMGARIEYGLSVTDFQSSDDGVTISVSGGTGDVEQVSAQFCLDASGFGRVLPRLLNIEKSSKLLPRKAIFTHIRDNISDPAFDRNKILILVHPVRKDLWYWLIPFSDGTSSIGIVAELDYINEFQLDDLSALKKFVHEEKTLRRLLKDADYIMETRHIASYSANVSQLWGNRFALLGNAGEFLDPVFSSGVTVALKSASLATDVLDRQLRGHDVDWEQEFAIPLRSGIEVFRQFITRWYDGSLMTVFQYPHQNEDVKQMICSILAGYVWDESNPFVKQTERRLNALVEICSS